MLSIFLIIFIILIVVEQKIAFKDNLAKSLAFVQDDILIRCESLKEDLELIKDGYREEADRTEKEICEWVLVRLFKL